LQQLESLSNDLESERAQTVETEHRTREMHAKLEALQRADKVCPTFVRLAVAL
jgi:hypothetical protein